MNRLDDIVNQLNKLPEVNLKFSYQVFTGYDRYIVFANDNLIASGTYDELIEILEAVEKVLRAEHI